ncbi:hypothetical protein ACT9XH_10395 [Methanococcoides methylutens]
MQKFVLVVPIVPAEASSKKEEIRYLMKLKRFLPELLKIEDMHPCTSMKI